MATITYQGVIDSARVPLNDAVKSRYTDAELVSYLNDGIMAMVGPRADLFITDGVMATVAGTVNQTLPAGGVSVMDVYAAAVGAATRGVARTDFNALRAFKPNWRNDTAGICQNWLYALEEVDQASGPTFLIYPQAPAGQTLNLLYLKLPAVIAAAAASATVLPVADDYSVPLQFYVAGRAELKDDEHVNSGRAELFLKSFVEQLLALQTGERSAL